ncbi:MAG: hypothetical protein L0154_03100 [Chloroflexi bacterium]|nr:hypothetical protein [Chloroflexota bacterium]
MVNDSQKALKDAAKAYQGGDRRKAQEILLDLVSRDETNEKAWLLLSAVVDTLEDREVALENVITLNPGNEKARKGLELVRQKLAAKKPPTPLGGAGWSDIDTDTIQEHERFGWDGPVDADDDKNPFAPSDAPPITEQIDWGDVPQGSTSSASSVDWGTGDTSAPAAYGSGRQIKQPSASEYDNMIGGLGLPGGDTTKDSSGSSGWGDVDPSAIFSDSSSTSEDDWDDSGGGSTDSTTSAFEEVDDAWDSSPAQTGTTDDDPFGGWESSGEATSSNAAASDKDPWGDFGGWDEPDAVASPVVSSDPFGSTDDSAGGWDTDTNQTDSDAPAGDWGSWGAADDGDPFASDDDPFVSSQPPTQSGGSTAADAPVASSKPVAKSSGFGIASDSFGISDDTVDNDDDEPFASSPPAVQSSGFGAAKNPFASSQPAAQRGGFGVADDSFDDDDEPFASSQPIARSGGFGFNGDPFGDDDDPFADEDNPFGSGAPAPVTEKPQKKAKEKQPRQKKAAAPAMSGQYAEYFRLIPTEIEAPASPLSASPIVLVGVAVLVLLNIAALFGILSQL